MECTFCTKVGCKVLRNVKCSDACRFRLTEEEYAEGQAKAKAILQKKGLEAITVRDKNNAVIVTTRRIKNA